MSPTCPHSPSFQNLPPQPFSLKDSTLPTEEVADTPVKVITGLLLSPQDSEFQVFLPQPFVVKDNNPSAFTETVADTPVNSKELSFTAPHSPTLHPVPPQPVKLYAVRSPVVEVAEKPPISIVIVMPKFAF